MPGPRSLRNGSEPAVRSAAALSRRSPMMRSSVFSGASSRVDIARTIDRNASSCVGTRTMMRTSPWLLALVGCAALDAAPAQDTPVRVEPDGKIHKAIATYFGNLRGERAYIQTDKPLYQPGETIWFRADVRTAKTLQGGAPGG